MIHPLPLYHPTPADEHLAGVILFIQLGIFALALLTMMWHDRPGGPNA